MAKLSDLGERALIERLSRNVEGIGDDAAWLRFGDGYLILSTDMVYGKTHVPRQMTPVQTGRYIVAINLSDIAAMGARPVAFLLSYGSADVELEVFDGIAAGVKEMCDEFGIMYAGGDTNETPDLVLAGSVVGFSEKKPVLRSGAKPGDVLCVTGELGAAALGIDLLASGIENELTERALVPVPRVNEGQLLGRVATSMTDISDSLAVSAYGVAGQSGVDIEISLNRLPIGAGVRKKAREQGKDAIEYALYGGGDYELLFTADEKDLESVRNEAGFTEIGKVLERRGNDSAMVFGSGHDGKRIRIERRGYEHFAKARNSGSRD